MIILLCRSDSPMTLWQVIGESSRVSTNYLYIKRKRQRSTVLTLFIGEYYVPWQEFANSVGRPSGSTLRIWRRYASGSILFRRRCRSARTAVHHARRRDRYREHVIFLSETDCTKRSFRCVMSASARPSSQKLHNATQCFLNTGTHLSDGIFSITCVLSAAQLIQGSQ